MVHECQHEVDLALLQKDVAENKEVSIKTLEILQGNGKPGLKTDVELLKVGASKMRGLNVALLMLLLGLVLRMVYM